MGILFIVLLLILLCKKLWDVHVYRRREKEYQQTDYFQATGTPYAQLCRDKGKAGEYLTWKQLQGLLGYKRFVFNCYFPTKDGRTSEADVILLHESGLYVLESKNYSGWIFGTETQRNWVQSLPTRRGRAQKNSFYNPIWQNQGHLKWLEEYLTRHLETGTALEVPLYSAIVFGDECELKDIRLTSGQHFVVRRKELLPALAQNAAQNGEMLTQAQIEQLYNCLQPLTRVSEETRRQHICDVQQKKAARPARAAAWKTVSLQANASAQPQQSSSTQGLAAGPATASEVKKQEASRQNARTENAVQAAEKPQNAQTPDVRPLDGRPQAAPAQEQTQTAPTAEPLPTADKPAQPQPTAAQPAAEAPKLPADEKLPATAAQPTAEAVQAPPQTAAASAVDTAEDAGTAAGTPAETLPEQSPERPTEEMSPKQQEAAPQEVEPAAASAELPPVCPWCGGRLVQRTARKGARAGKPFYGCSAYPACRYIRNIDK